MYFILSFIVAVLFHVVSPCTVVPGMMFYSATQRTILAPIVFQGRVLNTTTADYPTGQTFDACVHVQNVIKSPFEIPREICFGKFGIEEVCLTYVFEGFDYLFFLNKDFTARYDGYPVAAVPATDKLIAAVQRGYCLGQEALQQGCEPPKIDNATFKSVNRVQEGRNAVVHCRATGTFPLVASWYRGGEMVPLEKRRGNMLKITDATMHDTGRYTCTVKNPAGEAKAETYVQILRSACGLFVAVYDNITFTIQSPDYPWFYRRAKSCSWRVCPPQGKKLEFKFTTFDLRTYDKLDIINECDRHRHPWRRYCGNQVSPGSFVSRCNTTCMQIVLDSGKGANRAATGFQATIRSTDQESTEFDITELFCKSSLVAKVKSDVVFDIDLEINVQVLEIFKQAVPEFLEKGQEIAIKFNFSIINMFGCSLKIKSGKDYYIFASIREEFSDVIESSPYVMDFAVDPKSTSTPANFIQQIDSIKANPSNCAPLSDE